MRVLRAILLVLLATLSPPSARADQPAVERIELHRRSAVATAWLSTGPVVHLRPMPAGGHVHVSVTLAGGEMLEGPSERWITRAAAAAWRVEAGEGLNVSVMLIPEGVSIRGVAPAARASELCETLGRMLATPTIDDARLATWHDAACDASRRYAADPDRVIADAVFWAMVPAVRARTEPPASDAVRAIAPEQATRWLERLLHESPIEAAVVGDVTLADAVSLATRLLVDLPARAAIGPTALAHARTLPEPNPRPAYEPRFVAIELPGADEPWSYAVVAYPGPGLADLHSVRSLNIVSRIVRERVRERLKAAGLTAEPVGVLPLPARSYFGLGVVLGSVRVRGGAAEAERARSILGEAMAEIAPMGLSTREVRAAADDLAADAERRLQTPEYWATVLPITGFHGLAVDRLGDAAEKIRGLSAPEVAGVWALWCAPSRKVSVTATPGEGVQRP